MSHASASHDILTHVLLALAVIIAASRVVGRLATWCGQPAVIGEIAAGLMLGPSLLGWLWPGAYRTLLPTEVAPFLGLLAQLGIILFMFLVGLELDLGHLAGQVKAAVQVALSGIVVPGVLGTGLAVVLYPRLAPEGVPLGQFALFMAIALAVTAFPVLARILEERGLSATPLGRFALACAAVADVVAWCLLSVVVGFVRADTGSAVRVCLLTAVFIVGMILVVRPLAARLLGHLQESDLTPARMGGMVVVLFLAALTAEAIGIHALFGAFLLGAVIPHDCAAARVLAGRLEYFVAVVLLPAFFVFTGMRTQIGLLTGWQEWLTCGLIVVVATAGKIGGTLIGARLTGMAWRPAAALGVLMNTRGLMEVVVLTIGLDLGVISPTLFAMMILMALFTTAMTGPLLRWLEPSTSSTHSGHPQLNHLETSVSTLEPRLHRVSHGA